MSNLENMDDSPIAHALFSSLLVKYLLWVFWNTLGFALALPSVFLGTMAIGSISALVIHWSPGTPMDNLMFFLLTILQGVIFGLVIASCQGIALGLRKIRLPLWLPVNALTWLAFLAVAINTSPVLHSSNLWVGIILMGAGMGLLIGIPQWLLMHKANRSSWWWILGNILGGIGGFSATVPIAVAIFRTWDENAGMVLYLLIPLFGFSSSIISGAFLFRPIKWFESPKAADYPQC